MPIYECLILSSRGQKKKELILADSRQEIAEDLSKKGFFSISIKQIESLPKLKKVSSSKILAFTQDLYQFLRAKIPLFEALKNIQKKINDSNIQVLIIGLIDKIKQGYQLSEAMQFYPHVFNSVYLAMIKSGEESGRLELALSSLKRILEKEAQIQKKLSSQLAYPKFLALISLGLILGVLVFLVPSFKELLDGKEQKGITKIVFSASDYLLNYPYSIMLGISLAVGLIWGSIKIPFVRSKIESAQIGLFPFKNFYIPKIFSRFFLVFRSLTEAGVPLVEGLKYSKDVLGHPVYEKEIEQIISDMTLGYTFSQALKKSNKIPEMIFQIVVSKDEIGGLGDAFSTISQYYEEELERNLQQLATYIQPVMFILLGLVIGTIILSVLMPMTDTTNFAL